MTPLKKTTLFILVVTGTCIAGIGLILYLRSLETAAPDSTADQAEKKSDTPKQTNNSVAAPDASADAVTETGQEPNNARAAIAATVVVILMAFVLLVIIKIKTRRRKAMGVVQEPPSDPSLPVSPAFEAKPPQSESQEATNTSDWDSTAVPKQSSIRTPRILSSQPNKPTTTRAITLKEGDVPWTTNVLKTPKNQERMTQEKKNKILKDVLNPVRVVTFEGLKKGANLISSDGEELMGYYEFRKLNKFQADREDDREETRDPDSKKSYDLNEISMSTRVA